MALQPGRYIGHFLGLASDGKPIYAAYCCVPDQQQDSDLPSFVSVSESTSDSVSWDSFPPSSYPDSGGSAPGGGGGGVPCTNCLSRLCVVRDETGRIVDIYYYTDDGDYVHVPDCGYYGSSPSSDSGSGNSGGGGGGDGNNDLCCPQDQNRQYYVDYNITFSGVTHSGTYGPVTFSGITLNAGIAIFNPACMPPPFLVVVNFWCERGQGIPETHINLSCGNNNCTLQYPYDLDISTTNCPGNPTYYISIKPNRCASGSFVIRPA
jgi:hypothetical protein